MADIAALAKNDPDFFKYLQENDPELLDFAETGAGADASGAEDDDDEDDEMDGMSEDEDEAPKKGKKGKGKEKARAPKAKDNLLTKEMLRTWQKTALEVRDVARVSPVRPALTSGAPADPLSALAAQAPHRLPLGSALGR